MPPFRPLAERFWEKVDKRGPDDCWPWLAALHSEGYGRIQLPSNRPGLAHRVAWLLTHGAPVASGMHIDHLCRNRACVNPAHLEVVTPRENTMRGINHVAKNPAKTRCPHGHEYDRVDRRGWRLCSVCRAASRRKSRALL